MEDKLRIAVISDVHGNLIALDAVLEDIRREQIDQIVALGDMIQSGLHAADASAAIVGKGNIKPQTEQVLNNLQAALKAVGAELEHITKWNAYVVQGQPLQPAFGVFQRVWGRRPNPPAITVVGAGIGKP